MTRNLLGSLAVALAFTILLSACTQIAQFAAADASNAAAMAKVSSDPAAVGRLGCYQGWAALASGIAALPANSSGIFTSVEAGIEVQGQLNQPACQAIAGQVLMWGMRHAPGGNLLPF